MEVNYYVGLGLRFLHIFAAMALVGGALFQRLALIGPSSELPEDVRTRLEDQIRRRWSKVVMLSILLLLVSGLINAVVTMTTFRGAFQKVHHDLALPRPGYDILLTVKIVLALFIFFVASALAGRGRATAGMRQKAAGWLSLNLLLAMVLVAVSGVMRSWHIGPNIDKVLQELKKPQQSEAPPYIAPANAPTGQGAGTQPAAEGTLPAAGNPELNLDFPDVGGKLGK